MSVTAKVLSITPEVATMKRQLSLIATAAVSLVLLVGCSSSSDSSGTSDTTESTSQTQAFNDDDVMFAQMMIPHHEQAIEMADIALDPTVSASATVKDLATRIKGAQDPEIATMKNLLTLWGKSTALDPNVDHSDMMDGMLTVEDLDALAALRGTEFDTQWIELMIRHHEGALAMAEDLLKTGVSAELLALAEDVISAQQKEIDEMKALL